MHTKGKWKFDKQDMFQDEETHNLYITNSTTLKPCLVHGNTKVECLDNAEYICKCVNNHERMKATIIDLKDAIDRINGISNCSCNEDLCWFCNVGKLLKDIDND